MTDERFEDSPKQLLLVLQRYYTRGVQYSAHEYHPPTAEFVRNIITKFFFLKSTPVKSTRGGKKRTVVVIVPFPHDFLTKVQRHPLAGPVSTTGH